MPQLKWLYFNTMESILYFLFRHIVNYHTRRYTWLPSRTYSYEFRENNTSTKTDVIETEETA